MIIEPCRQWSADQILIHVCYMPDGSCQQKGQHRQLSWPGHSTVTGDCYRFRSGIRGMTRPPPIDLHRSRLIGLQLSLAPLLAGLGGTHEWPGRSPVPEIT